MISHFPGCSALAEQHQSRGQIVSPYPSAAVAWLPLSGYCLLIPPLDVLSFYHLVSGFYVSIHLAFPLQVTLHGSTAFSNVAISLFSWGFQRPPASVSGQGQPVPYLLLCYIMAITFLCLDTKYSDEHKMILQAHSSILAIIK